MSARLVLDSSLIVAAMKPSEPSHGDALDFLDRLREAQEQGGASVFAPPELWLEVHVAAQKLVKQRERGAPEPKEPMAGLAIKLVAMDREEAITGFLEQLTARTRGQPPFTNATDLVYLWVAWSVDATLITLDQRLLKYHGLLCDVIMPFHYHFG